MRRADAAFHLQQVEALAQGATTGGADRNAAWLLEDVRWGDVSADVRAIVVDPQTSGGLLVAAPPEVVDDYVSRVPGAVVVGEVTARGEHLIVME